MIIRAMSVFSGLKSIYLKGKPKTKSPETIELERFKNVPHTYIEDMNIRENSESILRFRKLPWYEWIYASLFVLTAAFFYQCSKFDLN